MVDISDVVMNAKAGRFELTLEGQTAFAEYRLQDGDLLLPHTVVPVPLEGRGLGALLARAALGYARDQGLKVKPTCAFIAGYIARHPEWQDLVHPDDRARLGQPPA